METIFNQGIARMCARRRKELKATRQESRRRTFDSESNR